jgi:hypothetical protein
MNRRILIGLFLLNCALVFAVYGTQAEGKKTNDNAVKGIVQDGSGQTVGKATVYLIPSADVEAMAKTPIEVKKKLPNDEPLEDNLSANIDKYKNAITDGKGGFSLSGIPDGKYFIYVQPADKTYLPGGDKSNKAMSTGEFKGKTIKILLSGNVSSDATFVGSSKCLTCHQAYGSEKKTLHKLGIRVAGKDSKLQDSSRFPDFDKGLNKLMAGTTFYFHSFDKSRGFDKYMISEKMPSDPATVSMKATSFKDTDGKLKFKTENMKDPATLRGLYG